MTAAPAGPAWAALYWRLSAFYGAFFGALGAFLPYWSVYLRDHGFRADQIGALLAVFMIAKVIAPLVWGWWADRTTAHMRMVRLACVLTVVSFAGVFFGTGFWWLVAVTAAFGFFWNAALPQFEAITLNHLGEGSHRYSHVRVWGSVGFILMAWGLGVLLQSRPTEWVLWVVAALFVLQALAAYLVPDAPDTAVHADPTGIARTLGRPEVWGLLLVAFLMQVSHGAYYTFYSVYLEEHGYGRDAIGLLWSVGVVAEIIVFMVAHRWLQRFGESALVKAALALAVLRWSLIAVLPGSVAAITGAQLLHAATFGVFHVAAIHWVHRVFPRAQQGRGQALYSALSFGLGGAAGAWLGGQLWVGYSPATVFAGAACAAGLGLVIAVARLRPLVRS